MQPVKLRNFTWSSEKQLSRGPLIDDEAEVVELLDDGFEVAADLGAVLGAGLGRLGDGDDAAIAPCAGRQGDEGLGEVGGAQLHLLAAGGLGAEHGSLADGAGVGVGQGDAQVEGVGVDGEKGIGPRARLMHIHIHALGGQRDQGQGGALAVAEVGGGLSGGLGLAARR